MTPAQHQKYIRRWICVVRVNHWVMRKGRMVDNAVYDASEWHGQVYRTASALAMAEARAIVPDDLRKACHVLAFGKAKSSKVLTNQEFDRLLILWGNERPLKDGGMAGLLIDPEDIASIKAWIRPEKAQRESYVRLLNQHEAAACKISGNAFHTPHFENLPMDQLKWLVYQVVPRDRVPAGQPF